MFGDGPKDMSHIYMGMAIGAGKRARDAEETIDVLDEQLGEAHASMIAWRASSAAFRLLCEAILQELGDPTKQKVLSNPFEDNARQDFLQRAINSALNAACKHNSENGNGRRWPKMLPIAGTMVEKLIHHNSLRMSQHCQNQIKAKKLRDFKS